MYPLYQANGRLVGIIADDEVDLTDVESFLGDAGGHQRVIVAVTKRFNDTQLVGLSETFAATTAAAFDCTLTDEAHGFHQRLVDSQQLGDFVYRVAVLAEDHHPRRPLLRLRSLWSIQFNFSFSFQLMDIKEETEKCWRTMSRSLSSLGWLL